MWSPNKPRVRADRSFDLHFLTKEFEGSVRKHINLRVNYFVNQYFVSIQSVQLIVLYLSNQLIVLYF